MKASKEGMDEAWAEYVKPVEPVEPEKPELPDRASGWWSGRD